MNKYLTAGFILFFAVSTYSQQNKLSLTLEQAVKTALENNHDIKQVKLDRLKADEQVKQTYGESVLPSVEGFATYTRAIQRPEYTSSVPFSSGSIISGTFNNVVAGVQIDQPLLTGSMFLATKIAQTYAQISESFKQYSESELVLKVKDAYYTLLFAQEFVSLSELQNKRAQENYTKTKQMNSVGVVSEYDLIKANVQLQNSIPIVSEAKNQMKLAENNLKLLMGLDREIELSTAEKLIYNKIDFAGPVLTKVNENNQSIKQSLLQTKMNELSLSLESTRYYPELRAFGNWQMQALENDDKSIGRWHYINSINIGLNLRIPIFKGFATDARNELAQLEYQKSIEALAKVSKEVANNYENTILTIRKTAEQIDSYKLAVDQAEKGFQIANTRYSSGMSTQLEITNAMVDVTQAKLNYAKVIHQYYVLNAQLDFLIGKPVEEISLSY